MSARTDIGLTGGVACGKSTLAEEMRARGWHVIEQSLDFLAFSLL